MGSKAMVHYPRMCPDFGRGIRLPCNYTKWITLDHGPHMKTSKHDLPHTHNNKMKVMGTGLGISGTMFFRFSLLNQVLGWWFGNSLILCGSVEKWVVALKGILLTSTNKVHPSMLEGIPWSLDNFFKPYMMWKWNLLLGSPNTLPRMQTKKVFFYTGN